MTDIIPRESIAIHDGDNAKKLLEWLVAETEKRAGALGPAGFIARLTLDKMRRAAGIEVEYPQCENCGDIGLLQERGGRVLCEDARQCYVEEIIEGFMENVTVSIRRYPSNTNVAYWFRYKLPFVANDYVEGPVQVWSKTPNYEFNREETLADLGDWLSMQNIEIGEIDFFREGDVLRKSETETVHICEDGSNYKARCGYYVHFRTDVVEDLNGYDLCERCRQLRAGELKKEFYNSAVEAVPVGG